MESQPQNPEFRIRTENFHPCRQLITLQHKTKFIRSISITSHFSRHIFHFVLFEFFLSQSTIFQSCQEGLPGLNQYSEADKVSWSRTQHCDSAGGKTF